MQKLDLRKRIKIFIENLAELTELIHNCTVQKSQNLSYSPVKMGLTSLAFYTVEEKTSMMNYNLLEASPFSATINQDDYPECSLHPLPGEPELPNEFSWVDKKKVSPVYSQLNCGSCYLFSTMSGKINFLILYFLMFNSIFSFRVAVYDC